LLEIAISISGERGSNAYPSRGIEDCSLWALPFNESNVKRAMRIPMYGLIEQVSFIDIDLKIKN